MTLEQAVETLSNIQFNQNLSINSYVLTSIVTAIVAVLSTYVVSYFKEKAKTDLINRNFEKLNDQLGKNTETTKKIEHQFIQKTWISQQIWMKKQEIYESIFEIFMDIDKYLHYEMLELNEYYWFESGIYQQFCHDGEYDEKHYQEEMESRKEYYKSLTSEQHIKHKETMLKIKKDSIDSLTNILHLRSLFLSKESKSILETFINVIKSETVEDYDEWQDYINNTLNAFSDCKKNLLLSAEKELHFLQ